MSDPMEWKVDRTGWPNGPWDGEPDRVEWRDEATGLPCLIVRNRMGALCGYVAVPPGHPMHCDTQPRPSGDDDPADRLQVHGGITYGSKCAGHICHVPNPGEPDDVYWFGFDMAHCDDRVPSMMKYDGDVYRDVAYVQAECAKLAAQLAEAGPR